MTWQLDIHVLDVGQGQSVLVVAQDPAQGPAATRTLLVDGGLAQCAPLVHDKLLSLHLTSVNTMICTNYDVDHSGGLTALLRADNAWQLADYMADIAVAAAMPYAANAGQFHAAAAGATVAVLRGARRANVGLINTLASLSTSAVNPANSNEMTAVLSAQAADQVITGWLSTGLPWQATLAASAMARVDYAHAVAVIAGRALAQGQAQQAIRTNTATVLAGLLCSKANLPPLSTGGAFRSTRVIDIAQATAPPAWWTRALSGDVLTVAGQQTVRSPEFVARPNQFTPLGTELFWAAGQPGNAAAAPIAMVVSGPDPNTGQGSAWRGTGQAAAQVTSDNDNKYSIGVVIRFNRFAFMTCGDLPRDGEDPLGRALTTQPLPTAAGGTAAAPARVIAYTCGHHGASTATSSPLLQTSFLATAAPATPIISCGFNDAHKHPTVQTTGYLQASNITNFYLTNCRYPRNEVPYSVAPPLGAPQQGQAQKGRLAGDNGGAGGHRGDIHLSLTEVTSGNPGSYTVGYWDQAVRGVLGAPHAPGQVNDTIHF